MAYVKQNELEHYDKMNRLDELISIYMTNAKMDDYLVERDLLTMSFEEALEIVLDDELYDLNFTPEETKEFLSLVEYYNKYKEDSKNAKLV